LTADDTEALLLQLQGGGEQVAVRKFLKETVTDPQQKLAKLQVTVRARTRPNGIAMMPMGSVLMIMAMRMRRMRMRMRMMMMMMMMMMIISSAETTIHDSDSPFLLVCQRALRSMSAVVIKKHAMTQTVLKGQSPSPQPLYIWRSRVGYGRNSEARQWSGVPSQ
jgi:hypothetical protein